MPIIKAINGPFDGQDIYITPTEFQSGKFSIRLYGDKTNHIYANGGFVADSWNYVTQSHETSSESTS